MARTHLWICVGFAALYSCHFGQPTDLGHQALPQLVRVIPQTQSRISQTPTFDLEFTQAITAGRGVVIDAVALVPHQLGIRCTTDLDCDTGQCVMRRCQKDPVSTSWKTDFAHLPLTDGHRRLLTPLRVQVDHASKKFSLVPTRVLTDATRYTLWINQTILGLATSPNDAADLDAITFVFDTDSFIPRRPTLALLSPPSMATDVPRNLSRLLVVASAPLTGVGADALWIADPSARRVGADVRPADESCPGFPRATCFELKFNDLLPSNTILQLGVRSDRLVDNRSALLFATPADYTFATAPTIDRDPAQILRREVTMTDGCIDLRVMTNRRGDVAVAIASDTQWSYGQTLHLFSFPVTAALLEDPRERKRIESLIQFWDWAGHHTKLLERVDLNPSPFQVHISEVLADPIGSEASQEFIELHNAGATSVDLTSWQLRVGTTSQQLPAASFTAGSVLLLVGPAFDAVTEVDVTADPSAMILRLPTRLGGGLNNDGEAISLVDDAGRLVSSFNPPRNLYGTRTAGVSIQRHPSTGCDAAENWRRSDDHEGATPGWL